MGTRLRKLKEELKGKKLSDGLPISGKNRLPDRIINKFSSLYGKTIRENVNDLEGMKNGVDAIYLHYR